MTRLHQVMQPATDLARATAFYRDALGLPFIASFDPPGLVFFDLDGTRLLLEKGDGTGSVLYLGVDDIDARREELRSRGVEFVDDAPHLIHKDTDGTFGSAGFEEWMTFFRDSEGNLLGLAERRAPAG